MHVHSTPGFVLGALLAGAALSGCGEATTELDSIESTSEALTPTQPGVRPDIHSLSAANRSTLVNAILTFITQPVLDEHANGHDWHHPEVNGLPNELFFTRHHDYLNQLENFLLGNGFSQFVPVPEWDPGTPIPAEFLVTDPLVSQAALNANPNRPIPSQFADTELCKFETLGAMAGAVESWHDGVHSAVGGAMSFVTQAPGAPIFWLWHGLLDDMYHERSWRCQTLPAVLTAITP